MNELVAIILVNYNGLKDTVECVNSIIKSDYDNYRIIVVDNHSKDANTIKKDSFLQSKCDVIVAEDNLGFSYGNNVGIQYASKKYNPKYFLLLNNDTIIQPDTISVLVDNMHGKEGTGIATCQINMYYAPELVWFGGGVFNFKTGIADMPEIGKKESVHLQGSREITFASGCLMLISDEVIDRIGLLDDSFFMYSEDADYCCKVLKAGFTISYTNSTKIFHKVSASTGAHSPMQQYYMFRNNLIMIKRHCRHPIYGYIRRAYRTLKEYFRGEYSIKVLVDAYVDYLRGVTGKSKKY